MKRVILSSANYVENIGSRVYEKASEKPSLTIPNQAESLSLIVKRYQNGHAMPIGHGVYYDNVNDFDGYDPTLAPDFDLSDISLFESEMKQRRRMSELERDHSDAGTKRSVQSEEAVSSSTQDRSSVAASVQAKPEKSVKSEEEPV